MFIAIGIALAYQIVARGAIANFLFHRICFFISLAVLAQL
jgi:hypothetical protein